MKRAFLWLRAATSIHVGAGETGSLIDLPVMREAATGYPFLPGSAMKGAMRDHWRIVEARKLMEKKRKHYDALALAKGDPELAWSLALKDADQLAWVTTPSPGGTTKSPGVTTLFGKQDDSGKLLVGDARLAFLPMRSLNHAFVWVTCPNVLERIKRDHEFAELRFPLIPFDRLDFEGEAHFTGDELFLEDYRLTRAATKLNETKTEKSAAEKKADAEGKARAFFEALAAPGLSDFKYKNVVVVHDSFFGYLARRRLPVRMRNRLEPDTKTVVDGALWSEESLPPETLLYSVLVDRSFNGEALKEFQDKKPKYLQVGGNESVGEGWLQLDPPEKGKDEASENGKGEAA